MTFREPIGNFAANNDGGRMNFFDHGVYPADEKSVSFAIASETIRRDGDGGIERQTVKAPLPRRFVRKARRRYHGNARLLQGVIDKTICATFGNQNFFGVIAEQTEVRRNQALRAPQKLHVIRKAIIQPMKISFRRETMIPITPLLQRGLQVVERIYGLFGQIIYLRKLRKIVFARRGNVARNRRRAKELWHIVTSTATISRVEYIVRL